MDKIKLSTAQGEIELTNAHRRRIKRGNLTLKLVVDRLNHNWTLDEAITLGRCYVSDPSHRIVLKAVSRTGKIYNVPYEKILKASKKGITPQRVLSRLSYDWTIERAVTEKVKEQSKTVKEPQNEDVKEQIRMARSVLHSDKARQQAAISRMRANRMREQKPHLFDGTPQRHGRTEYGKYLFETTKIGAYKVDCYGRQQLV